MQCLSKGRGGGASFEPEPEVAETEEVAESDNPEVAEAQEPVAPSAVTPSEAAIATVVRQIRQSANNIVLVTSAERDRQDSDLATQLQQELSSGGAATILVNAGGADHVRMQGLTDMCDGSADFGAVIKQGLTSSNSLCRGAPKIGYCSTMSGSL